MHKLEQDHLKIEIEAIVGDLLVSKSRKKDGNLSGRKEATDSEKKGKDSNKSSMRRKVSNLV
jgi:hypothetical protein